MTNLTTPPKDLIALIERPLHAHRLHDAHVQGWLDADACEVCGNVRPLVQTGMHPQCAECYEPDESWRFEEADRQWAEFRARMGWL